jgi:hypothetical protein
MIEASAMWRPSAPTGSGGRIPRLVRDCPSLSNRKEIRALDLASARLRERQRRSACWPARVKAIRKHLRDPTLGAGVAPEFIPKRSSAWIGDPVGRPTNGESLTQANLRAGLLDAVPPCF